MKNKYIIIRKDIGTFYNEDYNVFCKYGTIYTNKKTAEHKKKHAIKYAIEKENVEVEVIKII